jgi:hypothetical protein
LIPSGTQFVASTSVLSSQADRCLVSAGSVFAVYGRAWPLAICI